MRFSLFKNIVNVLRVLSLLSAMVLVLSASLDAFTLHGFELSVRGRMIQLGVCTLLTASLVAEYVSAKGHRRRYLLTHWPFLFICLPVGYILMRMDIALPPHWDFVLYLLPATRGVFVLADILLDMETSMADSLFFAYLALMVTIVYVCSLMFFLAEEGVNPNVDSYGAAFYWAMMAMTTVGSNIAETTDIGQALAVVLSATGIVLFPVFTVYISSAVSSTKNQS